MGVGLRLPKGVKRRLFPDLSRLPETELNPVTLRFKDAEFEKLFNRHHVERDFPQSVFYMVIGIFAWFTYSILDFMVLGSAELHFVLIVRGAVIACLTGLVVICFLPNVKRYIQWILSACMLIAGIGVIAMTGRISEPFNHMYYAGLILVALYSSNFLLLRFTYSVVISTALFASYLFTATAVNPIPEWALINNIFFLTVTLCWTVWTRYWSDYYIRGEFASRHFLIQEKKRSEELLEAAEAGNRSKSEFLAIISHELRTPLNAIIGFSEMIQQRLFGPIGSEKYESYVNDIADSGRHLLGIINDILDLSKAESGKLVLQDEELPVVDLIDRALRMSRGKAAEQGVQLAFDVPERDLLLRVDSRLFKQAILNLVSNAVKFTKRGGKVIVSLERNDDGSCAVIVEDTGIGIAQQDIARIFDPFVQVENSLCREHGGAGLGLPLVKKIAQLHGADLTLHSTPDVGTRVVLTFPPERVGRSAKSMRQQVA